MTKRQPIVIGDHRDPLDRLRFQIDQRDRQRAVLIHVFRGSDGSHIERSSAGVADSSDLKDPVGDRYQRSEPTGFCIVEGELRLFVKARSTQASTQLHGSNDPFGISKENHPGGIRGQIQSRFEG
jgi:hypothetical protein